MMNNLRNPHEQGDRGDGTLLREVGLAATKQRLCIMALFPKGHCQPLDAITIHSKIPSLDQVTIYRTLASLEKAGILRRVDLRTQSVCYERALPHHHHIVCTDCGRIGEVSGCEMESTARTMLKRIPNFNTIDHHSFELFGLCKPCSKSQKRTIRN